jgi:hypothetical protein
MIRYSEVNSCSFGSHFTFKNLIQKLFKIAEEIVFVDDVS